MKDLRSLAPPSFASLLRPGFLQGLALFSLLALTACATQNAGEAGAAEARAPAPSAASESAAKAEDGADDSAAKAAEEAEELSHTIRWTTASEVENFGFDVYRGDSAEGPFEVLTEQPLEGGGTVDEPREYIFVDEDIDPTKAYYYYVESISMSGIRERFTPVVKAKPKRPPTP